MRIRLGLAVAAVTVLAVPGVAGAIAPKVQFEYTGGEQSYTVPSGVVMVGLAVKGGRGGDNGEGGGHEGGVGALLPVVPGQTLFVEVGSGGVYGATGPVFGGGGAPGAPPPVLGMCQGTLCGGDYGSSGGGASDVRTCSIAASSCPGGVSSAATRVIVGGGGGGRGGDGNAPSYVCAPIGGAGRASNFQYPPGNPSTGPVPIVTAAGTIYPGFSSANGTQVGPTTTSAGGGSDAAGGGGSLAPCSNGNGTGWTDSVAGSAAGGAVGGTGGNASSLGPMDPNCVLSANNCDDAGSGGGGGGGYFGGGGGATGYDQPTGCGTSCNGATSGQGGGAGSSFVSSQMIDPIDESILAGAPANGVAAVVPVVEIDTPANGATYTAGQVVDASFGCGYDGGTGLGTSNNCTGSVANGSAIDTSPGTHSFTVTGTEYSNGYHTFTASVTYTVTSTTSTGSTGGGGGTKSVHGSRAGLNFSLSVPSACVAPADKLPVTLVTTGSSNGYRVLSYSYWVGRGNPRHKRVGKRTIAVYVPTLITSHAGTVNLPLHSPKAGRQTIKLVIALIPSKPNGERKKKPLVLRLPFAVC